MVIKMKKYLTTFTLTDANKNRLITTYRKNADGQMMRKKHRQDLLLLEQNYQIDQNIVFAYTKKQSIKQLVTKHLTNTHFYKFDIKSFFPSIDHTLLCTKLDATDKSFNNKLVYECSNNKKSGLALGLIPSAFLSNIYMAQFDVQILAYLNTLNCNAVYTRYSDDIIISTNKYIEIELTQAVIINYLHELKLALNHNKTKYFELRKKGDHIKVLGLNIVRGASANYVTVGRKFKKEWLHEQDIIRKNAMRGYIDYNEIN